MASSAGLSVVLEVPHLPGQLLPGHEAGVEHGDGGVEVVVAEKRQQQGSILDLLRTTLSIENFSLTGDEALYRPTSQTS